MERDIMLPLKVNYIHQSQQFLASSPKLQYRLGENALEKKRQIKFREKASRRGTSLHSVCESYIKNEEGFLDTKTYNIIELFKTIEPFFERIDNVHGVELALYSDHFGVAGRTDLIAEFDGVLSVIDYKTSNRTKKKEWCESYFAQGAFYGVAYEELTKIPVPQVVIIMAVDNEAPQLFVEKRDDWIDKIWEAKKLYELNSIEAVEVSE